MADKKATMTLAQKKLSQVLNQINGDVDPEVDLIDEYAIAGFGDIMCYDPNSRMFRKVPRGTKVFVIKENYDYMGRNLVYTVYGDLVCIETDELILLSGFD